jgi:large subunit ribosomal protein L7/L12
VKDYLVWKCRRPGPNKVKVIKVVREVTGLGLKEAKDVVDNAPKVVKEQADKATADDIKTRLEAEGAKVTLK